MLQLNLNVWQEEEGCIRFKRTVQEKKLIFIFHSFYLNFYWYQGTQSYPFFFGSTDSRVLLRSKLLQLLKKSLKIWWLGAWWNGSIFMANGCEWRLRAPDSSLRLGGRIASRHVDLLDQLWLQIWVNWAKRLGNELATKPKKRYHLPSQLNCSENQ